MTLERYIRPVVEAALGTSVIEAARVMREKRVGCLVVVREGRPVGVVTDRDLVVAIQVGCRIPVGIARPRAKCRREQSIVSDRDFVIIVDIAVAQQKVDAHV